ncbi:endonuclease/exonuclease/phosphatase family protein [Streptoalloteichus tenebrarius]|uniref:endonuclease/exonuclease/phosphatase family protein n=1 Tax=Streptoalloteichus tenebrarius (strain ATCC 17920 / DSM 40477 / JCM 4838 / CBS 697.72 / NBRC 16177 / NCIMB 11028 / NRRL B-12390 / A12253. 1 / ISP 5477) TaxID=1933 RepID=UPI0020A47A1F|nr:endonuclease/exonuclease/phosphatase family protein [Streptoalloteichus tenebrarius]BFF00317.1 endonuclease/exonuclease/phosphatase family protein [Streptoalloteichus tenebrarius]
MLIAVAAVALALVLAGHRLVPDVAGVGTVLDSGLPWLGALVPVLALVALVGRARRSLLALTAPALVWVLMFGSAFAPGGAPPGPADLTVVTQNLYARNPDPGRTLAELAATGADLVAVQEMANRSAAEVLDEAYPHHVVVGTVGLWSRHPIRDHAPLDLGLGWPRALRARVATPRGEVVVLVAHLGSARPGATADRDRSLAHLTEAVAREDQRVLVLGDLNTASTDRRMADLTDTLRDAQREAGVGLGFTWPATFPVTRPDHVLFRGLTAVDAAVVRTSGSDHRAATARLRL